MGREAVEPALNWLNGVIEGEDLMGEDEFILALLHLANGDTDSLKEMRESIVNLIDNRLKGKTIEEQENELQD